MNAEEGSCIRAVRRTYATRAQIPFEQSPDPKEIEAIAFGKSPGNKDAIKAYRRLGEVTGDTIGNALRLVDGLTVIGGGVSKGWPLFLPSLVEELNSLYTGPDGERFRRLAPVAFNLENTAQLKKFLEGEAKEITVPGSTRKINYDPLPRLGVGISRLGTSEAVAIGAYAFALKKLA
jgi:glucokinase